MKTKILVGCLAVSTMVNIFSLPSVFSSKKDSIQPLGETEIVSLIDQRISVLDKNKKKEILESLKSNYALAPTETNSKSRLYGVENARITLKKYGDIECQFCRKMHNVVKTVVDYSEGAINWEYKHFPLNREGSSSAIKAQAIECIADNYDNQVAWVALDKFVHDGPKASSDIEDYARSFGLNGTIIGNCLASDAHKNEINKDYSDGKKLGITSTPAIEVIDNKTGRKTLVTGFRSKEALLDVIYKLVDNK